MATDDTSFLEPSHRQAASAPASPQETPALDRTESIARVGDHGTEMPESEVMAMLDSWPGDEEILAAVIARPFLGEATILRLAALAPPKLYDSLVSRHALPPGYRREITKRSRLRPGWWIDALLQRPR
jgi:hypothetical protein